MSKQIELMLPVDGRVMPLTEVNDYLFNKKMMGDGAAIYPESNFIFSPVDGEIALVYDSKHAIAIRTEDNIQILIHIGLDSVKLEGRGFAAYVKAGDKVKRGDKLIFFDKEFVEMKSSLITPIVITNSEIVETMDVNYKSNKAGQSLMTITLK